MKTTHFSTLLVILLLSTLFLTNTFAQDYTQRNLPEGAKARLGKGVISDIQLSPDNTRLAITSSIGIWLYDVSTRGYVRTLAFAPDGKTLASISGHDGTIFLWNVPTK